MAILILGSNLGDRAGNLRAAVSMIADRGGNVEKSSSVYETEAWGKEGKPYYNQVISIRTPLEADRLLTTILEIEREMGRIRKEKWEDRTIDIDILLFDNQVIDSDPLTVPHPLMESRRFVLLPLSQLYPNLIHPVTGKSMARLLAECTDNLIVNRL